MRSTVMNRQLLFRVAFLVTFMVTGVSYSLSAQQASIEELELGSTIPLADKEMINVDDEYYSLNDFQKENGLLVIFSCNTCPYVKAWEPRYIEINDLAEEKEIGVVLLNPNENLRESLTEGTESLAAMKEVAEDMNYPFPYLVDENHELADAFGATRTPHIYLFNNADKLVYVGAIDDNSSSADEVEHHWLRNAINELAAGKEITTQKSKAFGCSIKRVK